MTINDYVPPRERGNGNPLFVKFKKLYPNSLAPTQAHPNDAGWDLYVNHIETSDHRIINFHTGIAVEIPPGYFGLLRPRSSIRNTGYLFASSGVIDSGYRGELILPLRYVGEGRHYNDGDKVAQLIVLPLRRAYFVESDTLSESKRGVGGFGSTGT